MVNVEHIYSKKFNNGNKDIVLITNRNLALKIFNGKVWFVEYNNFTEFVPIINKLFGLGLSIKDIVQGSNYVESLTSLVIDFKDSTNLTKHSVEDVSSRYNSISTIVNSLVLNKPRMLGNVKDLNSDINLVTSSPSLKNLAIEGELVEMFNGSSYIGVFYVNNQGDYYQVI